MSRGQLCKFFGRLSDCRSSAQTVYKHEEENWTLYGKIEEIGGRPKLVVPYVIKPEYTEQVPAKWPFYELDGGVRNRKTPRPESSKSWIEAITPVIDEAVKYYVDTHIHFREYTMDEIEADPELSRQYILITDWYSPISSGCTSDLGTFRHRKQLTIDVENCREDPTGGPAHAPGNARAYSAGKIAHELMHSLEWGDFYYA